MQYHKILLINGKTEHFLCINVTEYKNINKIYTLIIYYKKQAVLRIIRRRRRKLEMLIL